MIYLYESMFNLEAFIIFCTLAQVADVLTTRALLARGGTEMNPIGNWLLNKSAPLTYLGKILGFGLAFGYFMYTQNLIELGLIVSSFTYGVAFHNYLSLRNIK